MIRWCPTTDELLRYLALKSLYAETGQGWGDDHAMNTAVGEARENIRLQLRNARLKLLTSLVR